MRTEGPKKVKIKKILFLAGLLALLLPAGLLFMHKKTSSAEEKTLIKSAEAEKGDISTTISATGTLTADDGTVISLPVGIKISKVMVSAGDQVEKGTKIASVDKVSVANVLLEVNDTMDQVEDALDDLDDTDDEDSDDYLKKLVYEQELEELEKMQTKLKKWLSSGYITASADGTIASMNLEEGKEITSSSVQETDTTENSNSGTGQSSSTDTAAAVKTSYVSGSMATASRTSAVTGTNVTASFTGQVTAEEAVPETTAEETTETETETSTEEDSGEDTGKDKKQTNADTQKDTTSDTSSPSGGRPAASSGKGAAQSAVSGSSDTDASVSSEISMIETAEAYTLSSDDTMLVSVNVDEADINSVSKGQTAQVTIDALEEGSYEGEITAVNNTASSSSNGSASYQVDVRISKEEGMKEGMTASVLISTEEASDTLLIPSAAIQEEKGSVFVYTVQEKDGTLSGKTEVTTGLSDGGKVEITEGLSEGDKVYYEVKENTDDNKNDKQRPGMTGGNMPAEGPGGNGGMPSGGPDM